MTHRAPTESAPERRLGLVVGPCGSGTSLLSTILGRLGFSLPQPEVQADGSNPRGFGEARWVVDFHGRLLRERRVTVFDSRPAAWEKTADTASDEEVIDELTSWLRVQFVGVDNMLVKDPRIGWFLPLWVRCAAELGVDTSFVSMLRHPTEILSSTRAWYGEGQNDAGGAAAWLNITLHTERATRVGRRAFVRYEDLLEDWPREISRTATLLDLPWLVGVERSRFVQVDELVDPGLRRAPTGWDALDVPSGVRERVDEVWGLVSGLADSGGDDEHTRAALDAARNAYLRFDGDTEAVSQSSLRTVPGGTRTSSAGRGRASSPRPALRVRVARRVPARYRKRLRAGKDLIASQGQNGIPLHLQVARSIPLGYRERVPLSVQREATRAGRWVARTFRP